MYFWYQKIVPIYDIRNLHIFWYQKLIFWYQKMIFWYQKNRNWCSDIRKSALKSYLAFHTSQSLVIRTGIPGGLWLVAIVFEMFNYCCLIFLFITWTATAILKLVRFQWQVQGCEKILGLVFYSELILQNSGGVKFINFLQNGQPILKLLLKYCPKMFLQK